MESTVSYRMGLYTVLWLWEVWSRPKGTLRLLEAFNPSSQHYPFLTVVVESNPGMEEEASPSSRSTSIQ
jgi:hypothetical protein